MAGRCRAAEFVERLFGDSARAVQGRGRAARALERSRYAQGAARRPGREGLRRRAACGNQPHDRCGEERPLRRPGLYRLRAPPITREERVQARAPTILLNLRRTRSKPSSISCWRSMSKRRRRAGQAKLPDLLELKYRAVSDAACGAGRRGADTRRVHRIPEASLQLTALTSTAARTTVPPPSALPPLGLPARRGTCSTVRRSARRSLPPRQRRRSTCCRSSATAELMDRLAASRSAWRCVRASSVRSRRGRGTRTRCRASPRAPGYGGSRTGA